MTTATPARRHQQRGQTRAHKPHNTLRRLRARHRNHVRSPESAAAPRLRPGPEQGAPLCRPARQGGLSFFPAPPCFCSPCTAQLSKYPVLVRLEQRTQVPKSYVVLGALVLVAILHIVNPLAAPVSNLVGWALPAYLSFKALESPSEDDNIQWLTYWVVFGFFNFLESFAIRPVLYYLPWYYAFKTIFIIWLQLPGTRVSNASRPPRGYSLFTCCL